MKSRLVRSCLFAVAIAQVHAPLAICQADLIVDIASATLDARSSGSIAVHVRSRDGTPINVAGFQLGFRIVDISAPESPASGVVTFLPAFDPASPLSSSRQNNLEQSRGDYIFSAGASVANFAATTNTANPRLITVEDSTLRLDPFGFTNVPVNSPVLVATLELSQNQSLDTQLSRGQYRIELVASESRFFDANPDTAFNPAFTLGFSANSGLVTVAAVPESSWIGILPLLALVAYRRHPTNSTCGCT